MTKQPLISVTMPVYNAGNYVQRSIDSILAQTYTDFELIIINDASTDNSKEIILSNTDPRIRYFENEVNSGIVYTRNRCLQEARGAFIAVLDSDDIALPERLEKQLGFLQQNPDYSMCGTFFKVIDGNDKFIELVKQPARDEDIRTYMLFANCFCHSTVMLRNDPTYQLSYTKGYDIIEDYELFYRLSKISRLANLPEVTTLYRVHGNNISSTKQEQMFRLVNKMNERMLTDLDMQFTPEQLELHCRFLNTESEKFRDQKKIIELEKWINALYIRLKSNPDNNRSIIVKNMLKRWMVICYKTQNAPRFFRSKILRENKMMFLERIKDKIEHKFRKASFSNDF